MAMELVSDPKSKEPAAKETGAIKTAALKKGLLLLTCGTYNNVIRMHPSILMPEDVLAESMDLLEESFKEVVKA
jgi:4-aminobutyrate aminotransferase/(S)-3-amino-2-methylpropionate transaminase